MLSEGLLTDISRSSAILTNAEDNATLFKNCGFAYIPTDDDQITPMNFKLTEMDQKLGIIGPEFRDNNKFVYAPVCLTKESIELDMRARKKILKLGFLSYDTKKYLHPVPGVYFVGPSTPGDVEWRNAMGTPSFPYTVLTCVSDCYFGFLPHFEHNRDELRTLLKTDNRKLQTSSKHLFKNAPTTTEPYMIPFKVGDIIVTHPGMPFYLYSVPQETGTFGSTVGIVKVSAYDCIKHFDTRVKVWKEALKRGGGWKINGFNEMVYYYLAPKYKDAPPPEFLSRFQIADVLELSIFEKNNFKIEKSGGGDKKKMKLSKPVPKQSAMRVAAINELKLMPPGPEKMAKMIELGNIKFPDEPGYVAPTGGGGEAVQEKKVSPVPGTTKRKTATTVDSSPLIEKFNALLERIKKLDLRVWNPKDLVATSEKIAAMDPKLWKSQEVNSFKKVLTTLEKNVDEAEKVNVKEWDDNLGKIKTLLDENEQLLEKTKRIKEKNFWLSYQKKYEEIDSNKYWPAETVKNVNQVYIEKLTNMKNQLETVLRERQLEEEEEGGDENEEDEEEEGGGGENKLKRSRVDLEFGDHFVIPSLDNIPVVITDSYKNEKTGFFDVLSRATQDAEKFSDMISSHRSNEQLGDVYDKFTNAKKSLQDEILEQRKIGNRNKVDYNVSDLVFYTQILNDAFDFYTNRPVSASGGGGGAKNTTKKKKRRKGCKSCKVGNSKLLFPDNNSQYCGSCFIEKIVMPEFKKYEDKAGIKLTNIRNSPDQLTLWKENIDKFEELCEEINELMDSFTGEEAKVTHDRYNTLLKLIDQAKGIITPAMLDEISDESGDYEQEEEEEPVDDSSPIIDLPSDESEAQFTGEEKKKKKKKRTNDEEEEEEGLAHSILKTMGKIPVWAIRDKMVGLYCAPGGTKRALLEELVKEYNEIKEVYGIELMNKETQKTCMHNTYFETRDEADRIALAMENGKITTKIIVKEV